MVRLFLRLIGTLFAAATFAMLVVDGTRSIAAGRPMAFSLDDALHWLLPGLTRRAGAGAAAWDAALREVLALPALPVVAALAILFVLAVEVLPKPAGSSGGEDRAYMG